MRNKFHHKADTAKRRGIYLFVLLCVLWSTLCVHVSAQTTQPAAPEEQLRYQINLALDFDNRTYTGTERVHWVNRGDHPTSTLFFHLYPNMRPPDYVAPSTRNEAGQIIPDEPLLEVTEVRSVANGAPVPFTIDDQQTTLRLFLRDAVPSNGTVDIQIKFKGSVPEIDPEETGLVTHILQ